MCTSIGTYDKWTYFAGYYDVFIPEHMNHVTTRTNEAVWKNLIICGIFNAVNSIQDTWVNSCISALLLYYFRISDIILFEFYCIIQRKGLNGYIMWVSQFFDQTRLLHQVRKCCFFFLCLIVFFTMKARETSNLLTSLSFLVKITRRRVSIHKSLLQQPCLSITYTASEY